jgi:CheY-like chemotaxis protein
MGKASGGRILVVDDEPEVCLVLRDFLVTRGHEVALAESGPAALAALETFDPAVVLLDVDMPQMTGLEVLKRIVATRPGLPVIMVTANADVGLTSQLLSAGAADYVPKPFDLDYLDQAVSVQLAAAADE